MTNLTHLTHLIGELLNDEDKRKKIAPYLKEEQFNDPDEKFIVHELKKEDFSYENIFKRHGIKTLKKAMSLEIKAEKNKTGKK